MGYYSSFSYEIEDAKSSKGKILWLEKFFSDINNPDIYGFYEVKIYEKDGKIEEIELTDTYSKFYDDFLFATKLSKILESGEIFLKFVGEDGEEWGYKVSPKNVEELIFISVTDEEFDDFMKWKKEKEAKK